MRLIALTSPPLAAQMARAIAERLQAIVAVKGHYDRDMPGRPGDILLIRRGGAEVMPPGEFKAAVSELLLDAGLVPPVPQGAFQRRVKQSMRDIKSYLRGPRRGPWRAVIPDAVVRETIRREGALN